jgi:hypothetical protein
MKKLIWLVPLALLAGCHHEDAAAAARVSLPGYWFQFIFIVIPLIAVLVKIFIDMAAVRESLFSVESQFRRLNSRLDELEDKLKPAPNSTRAKPKPEAKKE